MVKAASLETVKNTQNLQTTSSLVTKKRRYKKKKVNSSVIKDLKAENETNLEPNLKDTENQGDVDNDIGLRYPILKDEQLVKRFLDVPMNNNQKGRLRLEIRDKLKGTSDIILPDVIYNRIQTILKGSTNLTDTELRKIRILYNMLTTALKTDTSKESTKKKSEKKKSITKIENKKEIVKKDNEKKPQISEKVKGKKRYVVFLGNLPLNIDKEKILGHFAELGDQVIDVRIPKLKEERKSAIAYMELTNEPTFELALSKHHSMLGTRRINVLYTTQKNGKITKGEAKSKSAKMIALQKSGKLLGSIPANRKRSHRRMKMKQALAKQQKMENA
ncbi:uncharacterized protein LOC106129487 [Amyelois transitella]|uniref:uncharacterized protein LOC106129487 n=1 Tax=Amyelois transitella TaxID=680683 RepID=UPI00067B46DD|nr:uncharacterized protein LOC106129487 [Amyelois transitella]